MVRRKGERTRWRTDWEYPHQVELRIPPQGFGKQMNEIHAFTRLLGVPEINGYYGTERCWTHCKWCFAHPHAADLFQERFGGERLTMVPKPPRGWGTARR